MSLAVASLLLFGGAAATVDASNGNETTLEGDGDEVTSHPESDQTIAGETSLEAGSEVRARVRSAADSPFLETESTEVDDDGTFEAAFDLSDVEPGTELTIQVRHDGKTLLETDGRVAGGGSDGPDGTANDGADESPVSADGAGFGAAVALVALAGSPSSGHVADPSP